MPTDSDIAKDLIGRKITEGKENGYFGSDWKWTIETGEISDLKIVERSIDDDYCTYVVSMTLQSNSCPTKYRAIIQIGYTFNKEKWIITKINSKGVDIVKTNRYNDCISTKLDDDGWGGVDCLKIKNNTDSPLIVGGEYYTILSDGWCKFSVVVPGLKTMGVGGTFGGGSVLEYRIHFVEPY